VIAHGASLVASSFESLFDASWTVVVTAILAMGAGAVLVGLALRRFQSRTRSLRRSVLLLMLSSLVIAVAAALIAAQLMVLSRRELAVFLALLGLAAAFATLLAVVVAQPLGRDVRHLESTVRRIASGDRRVRVASGRADEIGRVGRAVDDLVDRLDVLEDERAVMEDERKTLLGNIGHDLRSPLAALQAATEALIDGVAPDPQRYLRSMQRDIDALRSLIDDLALLSRLESGNLELERVPIDLVELADDAVESLAPTAAAEGVSLQLIADRAVHVVANPMSITRVIRNLIDNAIRHSPPGSSVSVEVTSETGGVVRVTDDGPGFPPDFRDHAFERFTRADPSRSRLSGGTGLGLAIARRLVEAHGGQIWIDSTQKASVAFAVPVAS
jgi:signal transduction histidine kinase